MFIHLSVRNIKVLTHAHIEQSSVFTHTNLYICVCIYVYNIYRHWFYGCEPYFHVSISSSIPPTFGTVVFFQTMIGTRAPADDETTQISILGCLTNTLTSRDHVPIEYN